MRGSRSKNLIEGLVQTEVKGQSWSRGPTHFRAAGASGLEGHVKGPILNRALYEGCTAQPYFPKVHHQDL